MKTIYAFTIVLSVFLNWQSAFAYCMAKTTCNNGEEIWCIGTKNTAYGVTILPSCVANYARSVSCQRSSINGVGGSSQFISCNDISSNTTVDSNGGIYRQDP